MTEPTWGSYNLFIGDQEIDLSPEDAGAIIQVLQEMAEWIPDLIIGIKDNQGDVPRSPEEVGLLLGALEAILRTSDPTQTRALARLHFALRQRPRRD